jgi:hypothetical protein
MPKSPNVSLEEFAGLERPRTGVPCFMCSLPPEIRAEAEEGRAKGITKAAITRWLRRLGYPATDNKVGHHLREHVGG